MLEKSIFFATWTWRERTQMRYRWKAENCNLIAAAKSENTSRLINEILKMRWHQNVSGKARAVICERGFLPLTYPRGPW